MKLVHRGGFAFSLIALVLAWAAPIAAQAPKGAPGGPKEGIQVHGHWVIEVKNPDGTVADRREFENAYVGGDFLPRLLTGVFYQRRPTWHIAIDGDGALVSGDLPQSAFTVFGLAGSALVMAGSVTAQNNTDIVRVRTRVTFVDGSPARDVTSKDLAGASRIHVNAGQQIQIAVTLSFCCAPGR